MAKERKMLRAILPGYLIEVGLAVIWYGCILIYHAFRYQGYCGSFDLDMVLSQAPPPPCSFGDYMLEAAAGYWKIGISALTVGFLLILPLSLLLAIGLYATADSLYFSIRRRGRAS
jgi:hypothetical protein